MWQRRVVVHSKHVKAKRKQNLIFETGSWGHKRIHSQLAAKTGHTHWDLKLRTEYEAVTEGQICTLIIIPPIALVYISEEKNEENAD